MLGDRDRRRRASLRLGLSAARRLIAGRVSLGVEVDLRNRLYAQLQRLELGVLRPPADRAADVAGDRRPAVGPLLPRLRPDLHRPVDPHDRARRGGDVRPPARSGRYCRWRPVPFVVADRQPLRQAVAARAPGGAAADRRADRRRRGERFGRPGGQGVRAGGATARALRAFRAAACSTSRCTRPGSRPGTRR